MLSTCGSFRSWDSCLSTFGKFPSTILLIWPSPHHHFLPCSRMPMMWVLELQFSNLLILHLLFSVIYSVLHPWAISSMFSPKSSTEFPISTVEFFFSQDLFLFSVFPFYGFMFFSHGYIIFCSLSLDLEDFVLIIIFYEFSPCRVSFPLQFLWSLRSH